MPKRTASAAFHHTSTPQTPYPKPIYDSDWLADTPARQSTPEAETQSAKISQSEQSWTMAFIDTPPKLPLDFKARGGGIVSVFPTYKRAEVFQMGIIGGPGMGQEETSKDEQYRKEIGPVWSNNSCAVDSVLQIANWLYAWRKRADYIGDGEEEIHVTGDGASSGPSNDRQRQSFRAREMEDLGDCARLVRDILQRPWSTIAQKDLDADRDRLVRMLLRHPSVFNQDGFFAIGDVWRECMMGVRQFCWTSATAYVCRSCHIRLSSKLCSPAVSAGVCLQRKLMQEYSLPDGDPLTVQNAIQSQFRQFHSPRWDCDGCGRMLNRRETAIMDRPPFYLAIYGEPFTGIADRTQPFSFEFEVKNWIGRKLEITYQAVAFVHEKNAHFTASTAIFFSKENKHDWLLYDSLGGRQRFRKMSMVDIERRYGEAVLGIYRRYDVMK